MSKNKVVKLKSSLRIQPLFSGFSMQIEHLHPVFSSPRLFLKDLPYILSNIDAFNSWYLEQSNEFKKTYEQHKALNVNWNVFLKELELQKGHCLDQQYKKIPIELSGAIELFYSSLNKPSYKLNGLVYDNNSIKNLQSFILIDSEATPNWRYWWGGSPSKVDIKRPIDHLSFSTLTDLILTPSDFNEVNEKISLDMDRETLELLTEEYIENPTIDSLKTSMEIDLLYVNHATVILKKGDITIIIDPLLNFVEKENSRSFYDFVPNKIDYVLITHAHYDHIDLPTLLTLRNRIGKIILPKASEIDCDFSIRKTLEPYFPRSLIEIDSFDQLQVSPDLVITSLPFQGEHSDLISSKATWLVTASGKNLWFGADCRALDNNLFKFIREKFGQIDAMFVGTVSKGSPLSRAYPHLSMPLSMVNDNSRTTRGAGHHEIFEMIIALNPKSVYIYALGYEDWLKYFLGDPVHQYHDEFIQLKKMLERNNKKLENLGFLVGPQKINV